MVSRYQKGIAVALLILNLSGARVIAVSDACERSRAFFSPALSFKAIAKAVTRQQWKQSSPHSLGARAGRYSSRDLEFVQRNGVADPIAILPPVIIALGSEHFRNRPPSSWRLPLDNVPAPPSQLQSKK